MTDAPTNEPVRWIKSTRSASNGNCVEVARMVDGIAVRDSKDPDGPTLLFSRDTWQDFVAGIRGGSFS